MRERGHEFWSDMRDRYEENLESVAKLCARYGITRSALYYHARKSGWRKRRAMSGAGGCMPENAEATVDGCLLIDAMHSAKECGGRPSFAGTKSKKRSKAGQSGASSGFDGSEAGSVGARIFEVLEIKLAEIEERIARGDEQTPGEIEREQRVIGNLIRNFDKLTEFNERRTRGTIKQTAKDKRAGVEAPGKEDLSKLNAVQFREEIARRIAYFENGRES